MHLTLVLLEEKVELSEGLVLDFTLVLNVCEPILEAFEALFLDYFFTI